MLRESATELESKFSDLEEAFRGMIEWKWDGRFETALGEFSADIKDEVLGILEQYLCSTWDSANVVDGPDVVREITKKLGGLMSGQLLLLSDSSKPACIFCAWWPWGSGTKISIRIAPFGQDLTPEEASELTATFRGLFRV